MLVISIGLTERLLFLFVSVSAIGLLSDYKSRCGGSVGSADGLLLVAGRHPSFLNTSPGATRPSILLSNQSVYF